MAKIGLKDVDGHNWPNLPLMKLSAWHKAHGDDVEFLNNLLTYDRVYKSKVFDFSIEDDIVINADEIISGGTGYELKSVLPKDVECIYPDYDLYGISDTAYGFLTRGCPRNCGFCIVSKKEGLKSHKVADLSDFWRGQKIIKLIDPNLLASPDAEDLLWQLVASKAEVDITQGLDVRLLDEATAGIIKKMRIKNIHFAWDNPKEDLEPMFVLAKRWLPYDERKLTVYVLTNYDSTHEEDIHRVETLRRIGFSPYVMVYDKQHAPRKTRLFQRYVNNRIIFKSCASFVDYDPKKG